MTFEEFFRADFSRLVGFLINLGYSEDVAEDAAADAMVVACREWSSLESPRAWGSNGCPKSGRETPKT
jgi:predicted RNA polymerase sigma factor